MAQENINNAKARIEIISKQHKDLFDLVEETNNQIKKKNFKSIAGKLTILNRNLTDHMIYETSNIYMYLASILDHQSQEYKLLSKLRIDMIQIGSKINEFLEKYSNSEAIAADWHTFDEEYAVIVSILTKRINLEEREIYPIFKNL